MRNKLLKKIHNSKLKKIAKEVIVYLEENLSEYRLEHSFQVAIQCIILAKKNFITDKLVVDQLIVAGLIHDITKEESVDFHYRILKKNKVKKYKRYPNVVLHSISASFFVEEKFHFFNEKIFQAVSQHTIGSIDMTLFSKILFAADYLSSFSKKDRKQVQKLSIDLICIKKIETSLSYVMKKKNPIFIDTIYTYNSLIKKES